MYLGFLVGEHRPPSSRVGGAVRKCGSVHVPRCRRLSGGTTPRTTGDDAWERSQLEAFPVASGPSGCGRYRV